MKGIVSKISYEELKERLTCVDLVATDVDGCLVKGFAQALAGKELLLYYLKNKKSLYYKQQIFSLVRAGFFQLIMKARKRAGKPYSNTYLMKTYENIMRGVSKLDLFKAATHLDKYILPGAIEVLRYLTMKRPAGMVSLGIDFILDALSHKLKKFGVKFDFVIANKIKFYGIGKNAIFGTYKNDKLLIGPEDKLSHLRDIANKFNSEYPLIIGHDTSDILIAQWASQKGGISIGLNPSNGLEEFFDIAIFDARPWKQLGKIIAKLEKKS